MAVWWHNSIHQLYHCIKLQILPHGNKLYYERIEEYMMSFRKFGCSVSNKGIDHFTYYKFKYTSI